MDGCGVQRAYDHKVTSSETALIVQSGVIRVPLTLVHSQVSSVFFMTCICIILPQTDISITTFNTKE